MRFPAKFTCVSLALSVAAMAVAAEARAVERDQHGQFEIQSDGGAGDAVVVLGRDRPLRDIVIDPVELARHLRLGEQVGRIHALDAVLRQHAGRHRRGEGRDAEQQDGWTHGELRREG